MDLSQITELVNTVAFPIAAFVMMFYYNTKVVEDLRTTINDNTLVIAKLTERLDSMAGDCDAA